MNSDETKTTWTLQHGIHRGTITSRDSSSEECESLEQCKQKLAEHEKFYKSIGYMIWYAYAISPEGKQISIHAGNSYR